MSSWSRRQFLRTVGAGLAMTAAGGLLKGCGSLFVQGKGDLVIGHQVDLTGGISSWGFWHDIALKKAVEKVNKEGGIAGRNVRLVVEDTQTDPPVGARKFRRLVEAEGAAVVIGSVHSGVNIATTPVAHELKTPYFATGMADQTVGENGNRYIFRPTTQVMTQVYAAAEFGVKNLGKKWTFCVSDYSWGHSHRNQMKARVETFGAQEVAYLRIPQGTKDFIPYLRQIPSDTEVVYFVFFGADTVGFLSQFTQLRLPFKLIGPMCSLEAIDTKAMANVLEGAWFIEYFPRSLAAYDTPENRFFREQIGVDEWGYEKGGDKVAAYSHCYGPWQALFAIKWAMEKVNWDSPKDTPALIQALEGAEFQRSEQSVQGDWMIRPNDHQTVHDHWLSQIKDGRPIPVERIAAAKVQYDTQYDFRSQAL